MATDILRDTVAIFSGEVTGLPCPCDCAILPSHHEFSVKETISLLRLGRTIVFCTPVGV